MGDQGEYNNQYWNEEEQAPQHHHHHHREPRNRRDRDRFRHNDDSNASDDSGIGLLYTIYKLIQIKLL